MTAPIWNPDQEYCAWKAVQALKDRFVYNVCDSLAEAQAFAARTPCVEILLWLEEGGQTHVARVEGGRLPDAFRDGAEVPDRFHKECKALFWVTGSEVA